MTTQFEMPGIALTRGCHSREGLGEGAEPEMGAMSWNMLWAPGLDAMEGSETMLYVEVVGIEPPLGVSQACI